MDEKRDVLLSWSRSPHISFLGKIIGAIKLPSMSKECPILTMLKTSEKSSTKCFKSGASLPPKLGLSLLIIVVIIMVKAFRQDYFAGEGVDADETKVIQMWIWTVWMSWMMQAQLQRMRKTESREFEHEIAFQFYFKCLSCFAHTLQLVVLKFSEDESLKRILKRAFSLVKKVNKSKATEKLLLLCRKKLVGNCPTRWSSTYLLIDHLLEVRTPLTQFLDVQLDNFMTSEWRTLKSLQPLLKPFAQYTSLVSGEGYITISSVIPIVTEINLYLEEMKRGSLSSHDLMPMT